MKKINFAVIVFLTVLIGILTFSAIKIITAEASENYFHSHTKAICDKNNFCEDYEIQCNKDKILKITPTGFAVQMPSGWNDLRDEEVKEKFCE
ncbi:MAG: hypothetical protein ABIH49_00510 [archaeon]